jgi:serine phosphatase RsbU (regulator of sigma subunit)
VAAGARLCILTDGISETENAEGAEFGTSSIEKLLCGQDPVREIMAAVESFDGGREAQDDRTVVVVERIK